MWRTYQSMPVPGMTSRGPRKHSNPTSILPLHAGRFPGISGFNCQGYGLAHCTVTGMAWESPNFYQIKSRNACLTDIQLHLNRGTLWCGPSSNSPLHSFHPHPTSKLVSAFLASFILSFPLCLLLSAAYCASFCNNTCLGFWSIPAGRVLSVGCVAGRMWKLTHLHWRKA